jgi:hypothetical protein
MNSEIAKINKVSEMYIEAFIEACAKLVEVVNEIIRILKKSLPILKEAMKKAYDDKVLFETFGTTDIHLILPMLNRTFKGVNDEKS